MCRHYILWSNIFNRQVLGQNRQRTTLVANPSCGHFCWSSFWQYFANLSLLLIARGQKPIDTLRRNPRCTSISANLDFLIISIIIMVLIIIFIVLIIIINLILFFIIFTKWFKQCKWWKQRSVSSAERGATSIADGIFCSFLVVCVYMILFLITYDDLSSRSQMLLEAFEILNIYSASTFATRPYQALTIKSKQDRQLLWSNIHYHFPWWKVKVIVLS